MGFFDEDIRFIEDLDWGRRATRKGYVCLFDSTVVLRHLRKYSLREMRKYFMTGALSEAKLFLKNGLALRVAKSILYWLAFLASIPLVANSPIPLLVLSVLGFLVYSRRAVGLGRVLLFPISIPFRVAKSLALGLGMVYWLFKGYRGEKVSIDVRDWEVVETVNFAEL